MNDTWYVLINPAAGKGSAVKKWNAMRNELDRLSIAYAFAISTHRGNITELARSASEHGYTQFVSVGGDGTHHEVLNGVLNNAPTRVSPTLVIISAGSGNDWARTHHIPNHLSACVSMMTSGKSIGHSAGLITYTRDNQTRERYFMNVCGMAFDGRVVETLSESFKTIPFLPTYLIAGLRQLITYRAPEIIVNSKEQTLRDTFLTIHAGISRYSGGGMQFVPHADAQASSLAITCVRNMSVVRLLANIYRLYTGTLLSHPRAIGFTTEEINMLSPTGHQIPVEADGEFLGYSPVSISIIPNAFRLVVP